LQNHLHSVGSRITNPHFEYLKNYQSPYLAHYAGQLVYQGYRDMKHLAQRFKHRYRRLLNETQHHISKSNKIPYDSINRHFIFKAANHSRVITSAIIFLRELFSKSNYRKAIRDLSILDRQHDTELVPSESCPAFGKMTKKRNNSSVTNIPCHSWEFKSKMYPLIASRINSRLTQSTVSGKSLEINKEPIFNVFNVTTIEWALKTAAFDIAIHGTSYKGLNQLFRLDDYEIFAFAEDLEKYFRFVYHGIFRFIFPFGCI